MLNQLARYGPVVALVEEIAGTTVLEVGSGSRGFARLLSPRWQVTASDVDFSDYGSVADAGSKGFTRVAADVCDLPFADAAFDVVAAVDLLEHVALESRGQALSELARVSKRRLIVAAPMGPAALEADRRLAAFYRRRGAETPVWLKEHLEYGFPHRKELVDALEPWGRLRLIANESVVAHERLAKVEALPHLDLASALLGRVLERGVRDKSVARRVLSPALRFLRGGDREPSYRTIAVLDLGPGG